MPLTPALRKTEGINFFLGLVIRMDVGRVARNGIPTKQNVCEYVVHFVAEDAGRNLVWQLSNLA